MIVAIHVPSALREHTDDASTVVVPADGATVGSALESLFALHPGLRDRLLTERDRVRPHVAIFVGSESIRYTGGLDTPVAEGAEITIVPAVSGGQGRQKAEFRRQNGTQRRADEE